LHDVPTAEANYVRILRMYKLKIELNQFHQTITKILEMEKRILEETKRLKLHLLYIT
jgi:hypothetical protein